MWHKTRLFPFEEKIGWKCPSQIINSVGVSSDPEVEREEDQTNNWTHDRFRMQSLLRGLTHIFLLSHLKVLTRYLIQRVFDAPLHRHRDTFRQWLEGPAGSCVIQLHMGVSSFC